MFTLFIIAALFAIMAQFKVSSTYKQYARVANRHGYSGAAVARALLEKSGIYDVQVEMIGGNLTDHYDPRTKVLRLSSDVYQGTSIAALGVAAHETGHAIQHQTGYAFLKLRSLMVPMTNIGSSLGFPLVLIGLLFSGSMGNTMINIGILLFSFVVAFTLVTLPVEFDASRRAIAMLEDYRFLEHDEIGGAKRVLSAAAMTYVAAAAVAVVNLLRLLMYRRD